MMEIGFYVLAMSTVIFIALKLYKRYGNSIANRGIEIEATILLIPDLEYRKPNDQQKIQVQIEPPLGRNFVTELQDVPEAVYQKLRVGNKVQVKYYRKNPKNVFFVKINNGK